MSWKEKMEEWGGGDVTFLSEDGEVVTFIIAGDPMKIEGLYKKQPTVRIAMPIITVDGFSLFITGKRLARRLARYESRFEDTLFSVIRSGVHGDVDATYSIEIQDDQQTQDKLRDYLANEFKLDDVAEAYKSAVDMCRQ